MINATAVKTIRIPILSVILHISTILGLKSPHRHFSRPSCVFEDNLINTTLTKRTLKKLLLDCATKTAFSFGNIFYEQTDGVSIGSSLAPVLANIILTEFEKAIVDDLIKTGIIAFYRRYVGDTLVLIKPKDILSF